MSDTGKGPSTASGEGGNTTSESGRTREALSELLLLTACRCDVAYTQRNRVDPDCHHEYREDVNVLRDALENTDRPGQPGKNSTDRAGLDGRSLSQSVESPVTPEYADMLARHEWQAQAIAAGWKPPWHGPENTESSDA